MNKRPFFFLSFVFLTCNVQAQTTSPDATVRKIFASLQTKDENAFLSLCPDSVQLVRILKSIEVNIKAKLEKEQRIVREQNKNYHRFSPPDTTYKLVLSLLQKNYSPEEIQKAKERYADNFCYVIAKGEKRKINWQNTTLINFTYDSTKHDPQNGLSFFEQSRYPVVRGIIHFKEGDSAYQMSFGEMIFLPEEAGWYGANFMYLTREGEPLKSDWEGLEAVTMDMASLVKDELPPPPPAKRKNKAKPIKKKLKS